MVKKKQPRGRRHGGKKPITATAAAAAPKTPTLTTTTATGQLRRGGSGDDDVHGNANHQSSDNHNNNNQSIKVILKQLKSSDLTIRHSTLAALLHTTFQLPTGDQTDDDDDDTDRCTSSTDDDTVNIKSNNVTPAAATTTTATKISRHLLMAIRDQIVGIHHHPNCWNDDDNDADEKNHATTKNKNHDKNNNTSMVNEQLYCCRIATECFNHYIVMTAVPHQQQQQQQQQQQNNNPESEWLSGWSVIFLQRINEYILYHQQQQQQSDGNTAMATTATTTTTTTTDLLYMQFVEQCIMALTNLIQYVPNYKSSIVPRRRSNLNHKSNNNNSNNKVTDIMDRWNMVYSLLVLVNERWERQSHTKKNNSSSSSLSSMMMISSSFQCTIVKWIYTTVMGNLDNDDDDDDDDELEEKEHLVRRYSNNNTQRQPQKMRVLQLLCTMVTRNSNMNDTIATTTIPSSTITTMNTTLYCIGIIISSAQTKQLLPSGQMTYGDSDNTHIRTYGDHLLSMDSMTHCIQYIQQVLRVSRSTATTTHMDDDTNTSIVATGTAAVTSVSVYGDTTATTATAANYETAAPPVLLLPHLQSILMPQMVQTYTDYSTQVRDQQIDQQIIQHQQCKHESARNIAQRLSASTKQEKSVRTTMDTTPATTTTSMDTTTTMTQIGFNSALSSDTHHSDTHHNAQQQSHTINSDPECNKKLPLETKKKKKKKKSTTTLQEEVKSWEELQIEWHSMIKPIQLSLDILIHWMSLLQEDEEDEDEITIPFTSSRMDVDDDENDTPSGRNMKIDEDTTRVSILIYRSCNVFGSIHELYQCLRQWYESTGITTTSITTSITGRENTSQQLRPIILVRDTLSDLLTKSIIVLGQMYTATISSRRSIQIIDTDVTEDLWNDFKSLLLHSQRRRLQQQSPLIFGTSTTSVVTNDMDIVEVARTRTVVGTTPHKNHMLMEEGEGCDETMSVIPIEETTKYDSTTSSTEVQSAVDDYDDVKSYGQLNESISGTMVALLRSTINTTSSQSSASSKLTDLLELLEYRVNRFVKSTLLHQNVSIIIRDIICMLGMVLLSSSTTATSSSASSDTDVETTTQSLLHTSSILLMKHQQRQPPLAAVASTNAKGTPTTSTSNMIISISDNDDDTHNCEAIPSINTVTDTQRPQHRHDSIATILTIHMEILNVLMDMYSDDDCMGSRKYQLFYHDSTEHDCTATPNKRFNNDTSAIRISIMKYFQQMIPRMKEQLLLYQRTSAVTTGSRLCRNSHITDHNINTTNDEQEHMIEVWREILENSIQFVQYKKDHMLL